MQPARCDSPYIAIDVEEKHPFSADGSWERWLWERWLWER
jgi:hypothetical protein